MRAEAVARSGTGSFTGSSTTDGSYFSRIDDHPTGLAGDWGFWSDCWNYGNWGSLIGYQQGDGYGDGCSVWSGGTGFWNESAGVARTRSYNGGNTAIPDHNHYAH